MQFDLNKSLEILTRTPVVLETMLNSLSEEWIHNNEGQDTWSPYNIVGHLIHGDKTDWMPRAEIILIQGINKEFEPFDRFAQLAESKGKPLGQLLDEFKTLRLQNIERLREKNLSQKDFGLLGIHPLFGKVTLGQLLSTWVVHDLNHIAQVSRVMAKQYKTEVGPWIDYLRILKE